MLTLVFLILAPVFVLGMYRIFRKPKTEAPGTRQPSRRDARGIRRAKERAERNQNPLADIPDILLDRVQGKIAEACEECGRPFHRPHTTNCKSRGMKITQSRSGHQPGEKL